MIDPRMTVAEVLERHPQTLDTFKRHGFGALSNPFLRRTFAHLITVEKACARHRVELEPFLRALNADATGPAVGNAPSTAVADAPPGAAPVRLVPAASIAPPEDGPVSAEMNVADAVERFPETRPVFARFFGGGCFSCPSFGMESVAFACGMHGTDPAAFLAACNAAVAVARAPGLAAMTINDILRRYPGAAPVLHRHGIDACCGGAKPLGVAAAAHGLDVQKIVAELKPATRGKSGAGSGGPQA